MWKKQTPFPTATMDPQILSKSDKHFKPRSVRQNLPHRIRNFYCRDRILSKSDEHLEIESVKQILSDRILSKKRKT